MNYQIREMLAEDSTKILEIYKQGIEGGLATFEQDVPTWEAWDKSHLKNCRFVLENGNNEIVGWCALKPTSNRDCYRGVAEVSVYIENLYQGKGLGTILLEKLVLDSEEHHFWMLQSGIFSENKASIQLHQKLGFRIVGTREKIAQTNDGIWRDVVLMERRSNKF